MIRGLENLSNGDRQRELGNLFYESMIPHRDSRHISFILLAILTEGFVVLSCFVCSDKGLNFYNIIYLGFKKQKST